MGTEPRKPVVRRPLTIEQILRWADAHHQATGKWPTVNSGRLLDAPGETWSAIYNALYDGRRGLPGRSSLAALLAEKRGVRNRMDLPPLSHEQILKWADSHHARTGKWPTQYSGPLIEAPGETWGNINRSLDRGHRGLPGGESLPKLIGRHRGVRSRYRMPPLRIPQILSWADAHHRRYREWPTRDSGPVINTQHETWARIDFALNRGVRGLLEHSSLVKLLHEHRGVRSNGHLPPLTIEQILSWCDSHRKRTGDWPIEEAGPVFDDPAENWKTISCALRSGVRGLPGGSSLAKLLEAERGRPHAGHRPRLTIRQILRWADDHHDRMGGWPTADCGNVLAEPSETWAKVDAALSGGLRGLRRSGSLAKLLEKTRGYQHSGNRPPLSNRQILAWADAHKQRTGDWPHISSGPIADAPGESWHRIDDCLRRGLRGLRGRSSLPQLLADYRDYRNQSGLPTLSVEQVLAWADRHKARTGTWPGQASGPIPESPDETWRGIQAALQHGFRGLPDRLSIHQLLIMHRGVRDPSFLPPLREAKIVTWAQAHHQRTGKWPTRNSGEISEAAGETWHKMDTALRTGYRGLPGGSSIAKLLAKHCGRPPRYRRWTPTMP